MQRRVGHSESAEHAGAPLVLHARVVSGAGGGPDKTILRSATHLDPSRYRMLAAYIHPAGEPAMDGLRAAAERSGCAIHPIAERGPVDPRTVVALASLCRRQRVSIWHGHDYKSNLLGLIVSRRWPMRLVTTVHGWTDESAKMRLFGRIDRWCLRRYERVVAVSDATRQRCLAAGVRPDRLTLIHNAIETDRCFRRRSHAQAKQELGFESRGTLVGVVGRMSFEKGFDRLIEPMRAMHARRPDVRWVWVGDGPQRADLEQRLRDAGVDHLVRFAGWCDDPIPWIEAMDLLVMPSRTEGLPNAAMEAMALGVPVAATDVGGLPELLDGGRCGLLLGENETSWATPLCGLLGNAAARAELAALSLQRVRQSFDFGRRMQRMMGVYDGLTGIGGGSVAAAA